MSLETDSKKRFKKTTKGRLEALVSKRTMLRRRRTLIDNQMFRIEKAILEMAQKHAEDLYEKEWTA